MKRLLFLALGCAYPLGVAFGGCSDVAFSPSPDEAGNEDARAETAKRDVEEPDADAPEKDAAPVYDENGWLRVEFDPNYPCALYTAPSADKMPPPIAWEVCAGPIAGAVDCRQMKAEWQTPSNGVAFSQTLSADVDATGRVLLGIVRFLPTKAYDLIAEADGPVHQAVSSSLAGPCYVNWVSIRQGKTTRLTSRQTQKPIENHRWGATGGVIDEPARVLVSYPNQGSGGGRAYVAGRDAFFEYGAGGSIVFDWTGKQIKKLSLIGAGEVERGVFHDDALFIQMGNLTYGRILAWTQAGGLQDFISYGDDVSHNAVDIGTDGVDLVWVEGQGRASSSEPFATYDLMASPFAKTAGGVQKRRVRSADGGGFGLSPNVVGCGYAVRKSSSGTDRGVRITRLSDGRSWRLVDESSGWSWIAPVAVTCTEAFISVTYKVDGGGRVNLARVRLDSLGPGEAAD